MFFTKITPYIYDTTDINGIVNIPDIFDNIPNTHSTPTILETAVSSFISRRLEIRKIFDKIEFEQIFKSWILWD